VTNREDGTTNRRKLVFPIPWLPMESLRKLRFSEDSDIWGFGVTLWEIFSLGEKPYTDENIYRFPLQLALHLEAGNRLPRPRQANPAM